MRTCDEFQELISALTDGELPESERAPLHAHLASCDECRLVYEAFAGISGALADSLSQPPEELSGMVMLKIKNQRSAAGARVRRIIRFAAAAACFALIAFAATRIDFGGDLSYVSSGAAPNAAPYPYLSQSGGGAADARQYEGETAENGFGFDAGESADDAGDASATATPEAAAAEAQETPQPALPPAGDADSHLEEAGEKAADISVAGDVPDGAEPELPSETQVRLSDDEALTVTEDTPPAPAGVNFSGELLGQIAAAQIYDGYGENLLSEITDTAALRELIELLSSNGMSGYPAEYPIAYIITFTDGVGGGERIEVWIEHGGLMCAGSQGIYYAIGTAEQLNALIISSIED